MSKSAIYIIVLLIAMGQSVLGQVNKQTTESEKKSTIPFQLTEHNNFSVRAILNGKDTVNLMFHTAATAVTLTEDAIKRMKSMRFAGVDTVKSWGGAGNSSRFSKNNVLQLGNLLWNDVAVWENINSGPKTDGKFGIDLFENRIIELDFEKNILILHANLPDKITQYNKLKLIADDDLIFVEAAIQVDKNRYTNKFLIHSGYSGDVLLDDEFVGRNKMDEKLKIISEKELKDSFGNSLKTKKAILPELLIGNKKLANVPVGFFQGAIGRQKMSIIGGDLLKRFNILIDAKREYIYLKPNSLFSSPFANS